VSTITVKLPQGKLRWWKMRLPSNEHGHIMMTNMPDVDPEAAERGDFSSATKVVYEIFDGCEGELREVVSTMMSRRGLSTVLYALAYEKPSDSQLWEPLEYVALCPNEERTDFWEESVARALSELP
jgi:hypothetical protein